MENRIKPLQWLLRLAVTALLISSAGACAVHSEMTPEPSFYTPPAGFAPAQSTVTVAAPTLHYASTYPPEPLYEDIPSAPSDGSVWVDGYWHWNGYEWLWVGGRWMTDRSGYVYVEPYYDYRDDDCLYQPGYWSPRDRVPSTVVVRDHRKRRPVTGYHRARRPSPRPNHKVPIRRGKPGQTHPPHSSPAPDRRAEVPVRRRPSRSLPAPRARSAPGQRGPDRAERPPVTRRPPVDVDSASVTVTRTRPGATNPDLRRPTQPQQPPHARPGLERSPSRTIPAWRSYTVPAQRSRRPDTGRSRVPAPRARVPARTPPRSVPGNRSRPGRTAPPARANTAPRARTQPGQRTTVRIQPRPSAPARSQQQAKPQPPQQRRAAPAPQQRRSTVKVNRRPARRK